MKKSIRAGVGLLLGLVIGAPSIKEIFKIIFIEQLKGRNPYALFGIIPAFLLGILAIFDSIAIIAGYENIGEAWRKLV